MVWFYEINSVLKMSQSGVYTISSADLFLFQQWLERRRKKKQVYICHKNTGAYV